MIDTDKYEGHTEGKWKLHYDDSAVDGDYLDYGAQLDPVGALHPMLIADAQLIADASLLLAEVERLRKEINQLPIDLHESLDMILEAHHPEVRESVMAMFGDAWGNNLTGYEE